MSLRPIALALVLIGGVVGAAPAQSPLMLPGAAQETSPFTAPSSSMLTLSASFGQDAARITSGLSWRVFRASPGEDGRHQLVARSSDAAPVFALQPGDYLVHVSYGLVGSVRRVSITGGSQAERVVLNAGGLRVVGMLGEARLPPERVSISIFVPEGNNPQGKLVARDVRADQVVRLPEGPYHIISTYMDTTIQGSPPSPTNSVVDADVRIEAGRLTEANLRHRAAQMTLKLVNAPGGEALANTSFTVLTPGGDVIREMIGAFPSIALAEGEYVAIARRDGRTYQGTFQVRSGRDRDVEILARDPPRQ
jgi:hypothetical protein